MHFVSYWNHKCILCHIATTNVFCVILQPQMYFVSYCNHKYILCHTATTNVHTTIMSKKMQNDVMLNFRIHTFIHLCTVLGMTWEGYVMKT